MEVQLALVRSGWIRNVVDRLGVFYEQGTFLVEQPKGCIAITETGVGAWGGVR